MDRYDIELTDLYTLVIIKCNFKKIDSKSKLPTV